MVANQRTASLPVLYRLTQIEYCIKIVRVSSMQTDLLNNYGKFHKETLRHLQEIACFVAVGLLYRVRYFFAAPCTPEESGGLFFRMTLTKLNRFE